MECRCAIKQKAAGYAAQCYEVSASIALKVKCSGPPSDCQILWHSSVLRNPPVNSRPSLHLYALRPLWFRLGMLVLARYNVTRHRAPGTDLVQAGTLTGGENGEIGTCALSIRSEATSGSDGLAEREK